MTLWACCDVAWACSFTQPHATFADSSPSGLTCWTDTRWLAIDVLTDYVNSASLMGPTFRFRRSTMP